MKRSVIFGGLYIGSCNAWRLPFEEVCIQGLVQGPGFRGGLQRPALTRA